MILHLKAVWNKFLFKERSPLPMAIVRIFVGLVFVAMLCLLNTEFDTWYGASSGAVVSIESARRCLPKFPYISLLTLSEPVSGFLLFFQFAALSAGVFLIAGYHTRASAFVCFIVMQSLLRRNPFVASASDELLSEMLFYLFLSDAGLAFSVDRLRLLRNKQFVPIKTWPWAQRLLQIQLCYVYLQSFCTKIAQPEWQDGSAVFKVLQVKELSNFPLPEMITGSHEICQILTWSTLALEASLPVLLWVKALRCPAISVGILFHLGMEYCLNIPFFQALMIAGLLAFVDPPVFARILRKCSKRISRSS